MPGLVPGIHVFSFLFQDVDGRDKPGHDGNTHGVEPVCSTMTSAVFQSWFAEV
jgi:hypothetical protein